MTQELEGCRADFFPDRGNEIVASFILLQRLPGSDVSSDLK
jgi:hypothetical protein